MKRIICALLLSVPMCNAWAQGSTSTIGGATDWYWKLYRTSTDGNLNFYNRRNVTDPEVLRIKFLDQGGLQLIGGNLYSDRSLFLGGATDYYWRMERVQGDGSLRIYSRKNTSDPEIIGLSIFENGNVGIGTGSVFPDARLAVKGLIHTNEVRVDLAGSVMPDYVFSSNYKLRSLREVETFIQMNHHLPEVPSASEIENNGLNLKEMNLALLKKIEELTLYMIEANKNIKDLENEIQLLKKMK